MAAGIVSPVLATLVWLILFNSYRQEKKVLVKQLVLQLKAPDICSMTTPPAPVANTQQTDAFINPVLLASAGSVSNSGQLLLDGPSSSSSMVFGTGSSRRAASGDPFMYDPDDPIMMAEPAENIQRVARQITQRCLQRWDGFMGFRASTDSLGRQSGIWRERFDGVRCASLLLAFRRLNSSLAYNQPGNTGRP